MKSKVFRRLLIGGLFFVLCFWRWGDDYWHTKWAVLLWMLAGWLAWRVTEETSWRAGLFFGYALANGIWFMAWRESSIGSLPPMAQTGFESLAAQGCFYWMFLVAAAMEFEVTDFTWVRRLFGWSCLVGALYVIAEYALFDQRGRAIGGFVDQGSMMGCWLAVTYPFLAFEGRETSRGAFLATLPVVAAQLILLIQGQVSNPMGVSAVVLVVFLIPAFWGVFKKWVLVVGLVLGLGGMVVVGLMANELFFSDSYRFWFYRIVWEWWFENANRWTGQGLGSFTMWGPFIQQLHEFPQRKMFWMHSDWQQVVFELGILGGVLCLGVAAQAARNCWLRKDLVLLSSLAGLAGSMVFNYPWRLPMFAFLGTMLLVMALRKYGPAKT